MEGYILEKGAFRLTPKKITDLGFFLGDTTMKSAKISKIINPGEEFAIDINEDGELEIAFSDLSIAEKFYEGAYNIVFHFNKMKINIVFVLEEKKIC